jgi:hypothetical protein
MERDRAMAARAESAKERDREAQVARLKGELERVAMERDRAMAARPGSERAQAERWRAELERARAEVARLEAEGRAQAGSEEVPLAVPIQMAGPIQIASPDQLAWVEVSNSRGDWYAEGLGGVRVDSLEAGTYKACQFAKDGRAYEQTVVVTPGKERYELNLPSKPRSALVDDLVGQIGQPLAQRLLEEAGLYPWPCPKAVLAQAVRAADLDDRSVLPVTQALGLASLPRGTTAFRLVLGVEKESPAKPYEESPAKPKAILSQMQLWLGPLGAEDQGLVKLQPGASKVPGLAVYTFRTEPGAYRLRVDGPDEARNYALELLPGRLAELVLYRGPDGGLQLSQFAPASEGGDWRRASQSVRFLSRVQCDLVAGQARAVPALLDQLAKINAVDPFAWTIDGYLNALRGDEGGTVLAAQRLTQEFKRLPDGHVILGRAFEQQHQDEAARREYALALDLGLPTLAPVLDYLWNGVRVCRVDLAKTRYGGLLQRVFERRLPLQLWTTWTQPRSGGKR